RAPHAPLSCPTRRSSDLGVPAANPCESCCGKSFATETEASMPESADQAATASSTAAVSASPLEPIRISRASSEEVSSPPSPPLRSEEHTSELQSRFDLVC